MKKYLFLFFLTISFSASQLDITSLSQAHVGEGSHPHHKYSGKKESTPYMEPETTIWVIQARVSSDSPETHYYYITAHVQGDSGAHSHGSITGSFSLTVKSDAVYNDSEKTGWWSSDWWDASISGYVGDVWHYGEWEDWE